MKRTLFIILALLSANCAGGVMFDLYPVQPMVGFIFGWIFNALAVLCMWIAHEDEQTHGR